MTRRWSSCWRAGIDKKTVTRLVQQAMEQEGVCVQREGAIYRIGREARSQKGGRALGPGWCIKRTRYLAVMTSAHKIGNNEPFGTN